MPFLQVPSGQIFSAEIRNGMVLYIRGKVPEKTNHGVSLSDLTHQNSDRFSNLNCLVCDTWCFQLSDDPDDATDSRKVDPAPGYMQIIDEEIYLLFKFGEHLSRINIDTGEMAFEMEVGGVYIKKWRVLGQNDETLLPFPTRAASEALHPNNTIK